MNNYEVKEFLDKQEYIISNLTNLIRILTYKERVKDGKLCDSINSILTQLKQGSYENGPKPETWPDWKKKPVKSAIKYLCKVLDIDIELFNIELF